MFQSRAVNAHDTLSLVLGGPYTPLISEEPSNGAKRERDGRDSCDTLPRGGLPAMDHSHNAWTIEKNGTTDRVVGQDAWFHGN